ncbi:hypothetical protein AKJ16_DCAP06616 [Drosera capensis]
MRQPDTRPAITLSGEMLVKQKLVRPIQLADQVIKTADEASSFKTELSELKSKTSKLADLLRQAARSSSDLYDRPTLRILDNTEQVLEKALSLAVKCRSGNGILKRALTIIPAAAFRKTASMVDNSVWDVSWLLRASAGNGDSSDSNSNSNSDLLGLPPIASNEPILCLIWEQIAILHHGSLEDKSEAAASLVSLAKDNDRYGELIVKEGGVGPLLKLIKEGKIEGQENAVKAMGLLGRVPESVEMMVKAGVCQVFAKILKEGNMKVQAMVAWAVAELAEHYVKCQDHFAQQGVVRLLVGHLAFETVQEHSRYTVVGGNGQQRPNSVHQAAVVMVSGNNGAGGSQGLNHRDHGFVDHDDHYTQIPHPSGRVFPSHNTLHKVVTSTMAMKAQPSLNGVQKNGNNGSTSNGKGAGVPSQSPLHHLSSGSHQQSLNGNVDKGKEAEDPATKADMKAKAAAALWRLANGNPAICRSITESRALLCFAVLLEKGSPETQYNSAMALMEITAVAERDTDLRRSAFKPNSPACKAVVEQLLKVIEEADAHFLVPCVKAIGNLARMFTATETRFIGPLVQLLETENAELSREAAVALTKFANGDNYLHLDHSKAIISAGGIKHLVQLVYFGEAIVKAPALVLLCYIAFNVPEELVGNDVLTVLEWASKQPNLTQDEREGLLLEAKSKVELYQSRGTNFDVCVHLHRSIILLSVFSLLAFLYNGGPLRRRDRSLKSYSGRHYPELSTELCFMWHMFHARWSCDAIGRGAHIPYDSDSEPHCNVTREPRNEVRLVYTGVHQTPVNMDMTIEARFSALVRKHKMEWLFRL